MDMFRRSGSDNVVPLPASLDQHIARSRPSQDSTRWCVVVEVHQQVTTTRWCNAQATGLDHVEQLLIRT